MYPSRSLFIALAALAALALSACDHGYTNVSIAGGDIRLHHGYVTIQADDAPDATINADGRLRIDSREVATDPAQRQLLRDYYARADGIAQQGVAIGKAGASMAGGTVGDVLENLFDGHPDRIDAAVNKRTDRLLSRVAGICDSLHALQQTQDKLAASLDAFRPYANLRADDVNECHKNISDARKQVAKATHS